MEIKEIKQRLLNVNMTECADFTGLAYFRINYIKTGKCLQLKAGEHDKLVDYLTRIDKIEKYRSKVMGE